MLKWVKNYWYKIVIVIGIFIAVQLLYIVFIGRIMNTCPDFDDSYDAVVVFGNKVYPNGTLSPVLKSRMDAAFKISKDEYCNKSGYIIVSGGLGKEGVYEAEAMKEYLVNLGYDSDKIIVDNLGNNSYLTAINAKKIGDERGFNSFLVVTSYYHVLRAKQAMYLAGVEYVGGQGSKYVAFQDIVKIPRELVGIYVYFLKYKVF